MTVPANPFQPPSPSPVPEPTPLSAPPLTPEVLARDVDTVPEPVLPPALVSLTHEQLSQLLADAVRAGAAQQSAANALGAPAIVSEVPEEWSLNRLLREMAQRTPWHNERAVRAAFAAIDKWAPEPDETDGV